jgi:hypothetical protein
MAKVAYAICDRVLRARTKALLAAKSREALRSIDRPQCQGLHFGNARE